MNPITQQRPGRWISVLLIVLGSIGLVFAVGGGVARGVASHGSTSESWSASADGVSELRLSTSAALFQVRFDDVAEAQLQATTDGGPVQQWRLEREGDALVVDTRSRWGFFSWTWFGDRGEERVVLTLPTALERAALDLDADISAGALDADADWGTAAVDVSAGGIRLAGSAEALDVQVSAGEARVDIDSPGTVSLDVSAGRIFGEITGEQPGSITAQVSAGDITLTIPEAEYAVTQDVSAGEATIDVVSDPAAASTIDVDVSAGSVTLRGDRR